MAAQEATEFVAFSNARMFNYVVSKEDVCQKLVERILGIEVDRIEFEAEEHSIQPGLQGHGVRLDVYARGGGKSFDVEMQAQTEFYIGCRLRYYQSVIDYDLLRKGMEYGDLPFSYIIFLCVNDPLGSGLPVYTVAPQCEEMPECHLEMRCKWLVLNGSAWAQEEDEGLRAHLKYIESGKVTEGDELDKQIDRLVLEANNDERVKGEMISVSTVEENAERRVRMAKKFYREEGLEEGRAEGRAQETARITALVSRLVADGREGDLVLLEDPEKLRLLLSEYSL